MLLAKVIADEEDNGKKEAKSGEISIDRSQK